MLGKVPGSSYVYRNIKQYPDSLVYPGILAFRIGETSGGDMLNPASILHLSSVIGQRHL